MGGERRKLLILEGAGLPVEELKRALGEQYELVEGPTAMDGGIDAVVAAPGAINERLGEEESGIVLSAVGEGVCLADSAGQIIWANERFRELPADVRRSLSEACAEILIHAEGNGEAEGEQRRREIDGGEKVFEAGITLARTTSRPERLVAVVVRDISDRRRFEQKLQGLEQAGEELLRFDSDQVRQMNGVERLRLVEERIVRAMHDLLHFDHFAIRLIDPKSRKLETVVSHGLPEEIADLDLYPEESGSGVSGWVASTGRSYLCSDTQSDPLFLPGMEGASSSLTVPLRLFDKVIGILDVESTRAAAFGEQDRQFVELFARHVAMALHMLDLLVAERSSTNAIACDRVEDELSEPLDDILSETEALIRESAGDDPTALRHLQRIRRDVSAIRQRVHDVASGPQTLLGVERAMHERRPEPALIGKRVLIADDEQKIRRIIGAVLRHRGCQVDLCENGEQAIARLENAAPGEGYDLIISDIKMPDRNGYEVFHTARRMCGAVPVILMTGFGYDPHHSIVRASQEGLQAVLFKPFQIERMLDEVRRALAAEAPDAD